jgi:hypothetical protein
LLVTQLGASADEGAHGCSRTSVQDSRDVSNGRSPGPPTGVGPYIYTVELRYVVGVGRTCALTFWGRFCNLRRSVYVYAVHIPSQQVPDTHGKLPDSVLVGILQVKGNATNPPSGSHMIAADQTTAAVTARHCSRYSPIPGKMYVLVIWLGRSSF